MNNTRNSFKTLGDIITVVLLIGAFAMAFYFGFFHDADGAVRLTGGYLSLLTVGGALILFAVGSFGAYSTRKKKNAITPGFLVLFCAQLAAIVGLGAVCYAVYFDLFADTLASPVLRALYIICITVIILGYAETVFISEPRFGSSGEYTGAAAGAEGEAAEAEGTEESVQPEDE